MADEFTIGKAVCIHLVIPSQSGKIKTGTANVEGINPNPNPKATTFDIACCPGSGIPTSMSSETVAVTCPKCKATDIFKKLHAEQTQSIGISDADVGAFQSFVDQQKSAHEAKLAEIAAAGGSFVKPESAVTKE